MTDDSPPKPRDNVVYLRPRPVSAADAGPLASQVETLYRRLQQVVLVLDVMDESQVADAQLAELNRATRELNAAVARLTETVLPAG